MSLLAFKELSVRYGDEAALRDVSLALGPGEVVALVGRSGSGKSTLAAAALGLLAPDAEITGRVLVEERDLASLTPSELRALRGGRVGMIFQEPATALNPALTIGRQIGEVLAAHSTVARDQIEVEVMTLLARVGLVAPPSRYPHMLSGGQRQRVAVAMAIAARPPLLVADEPTAALDPAARDAILDLLTGLAREHGMGLLLVSHDLALVARATDRIAVLAEGRLVEDGPTRERLARPMSLELVAMVAAETEQPPTPVPIGSPGLLQVRGLGLTYPASGRLFERRRVPAVADIDLELAAGETLAVVGASGSGKTTLARAVLGLVRPNHGSILVEGQPWRGGRADRPLRRRVQAVFQDPADSLDPTMTVAEIVAEPLRLLGRDPPLPFAVERVAEALALVGLDPAAAARRSHAFSGGQRQRIALARALIIRPRLIVLDEALSALDPELRAEIAALLLRLQREHGLAYLFISHDHALVRRLAHRVVVLDGGRIVAEGTPEEVLAPPFFVIPAKAGTQLLQVSRKTGFPLSRE